MVTFNRSVIIWSTNVMTFIDWARVTIDVIGSSHIWYSLLLHICTIIILFFFFFGIINVHIKLHISRKICFTSEKTLQYLSEYLLKNNSNLWMMEYSIHFIQIILVVSRPCSRNVMPLTFRVSFVYERFVKNAIATGLWCRFNQIELLVALTMLNMLVIQSMSFLNYVCPCNLTYY